MQKIWNHEAQKIGASRNQRPSGKVRTIVHFLDALQDARLGFFADVGMIAEGLRDGDNRDA